MLKMRRSMVLLALMSVGALLIAPGCRMHTKPLSSETVDAPTVTPQEGRLIAQWLRTEWHRPLPFKGVRLIYADGDTVYVETTYNRLVALDAETGLGKWVIKTNLPLDYAPVALGDRLYFFAGETLYIAERETGVVLQSKNPRLGVLVQPVVGKDTIYVGTTSGKTHGMDLSDIWPAWTRSLEALPIGLAYMPGEKLFVITDEGELVCINAENGSFIFQQKLWDKAPIAGPTVSGEFVYVGGRDLFMYAFDSGGNTVWRTPVSGVTMQPPVVLGDIVVGILNPEAAVVLNATTGELLWRQAGPAHFITASDSRLYFLDADKERVLCFDRETGEPQGAVATRDLFTFSAEPMGGRFAASNKKGEVYGFVDLDEVEIE